MHFYFSPNLEVFKFARPEIQSNYIKHFYVYLLVFKHGLNTKLNLVLKIKYGKVTFS